MSEKSEETPEELVGRALLLSAEATELVGRALTRPQVAGDPEACMRLGAETGLMVLCQAAKDRGAKKFWDMFWLGLWKGNYNVVEKAMLWDIAIGLSITPRDEGSRDIYVRGDDLEPTNLSTFGWQIVRHMKNVAELEVRELKERLSKE